MVQKALNLIKGDQEGQKHTFTLFQEFAFSLPECLEFGNMPFLELLQLILMTTL